MLFKKTVGLEFASHVVSRIIDEVTSFSTFIIWAQGKIIRQAITHPLDFEVKVQGMFFITPMPWRTQRILKRLSCRPPDGQWARPGTVDGPIGRFLLPIGGALLRQTWRLPFHIKAPGFATGSAIKFIPTQWFQGVLR